MDDFNASGASLGLLERHKSGPSLQPQRTCAVPLVLTLTLAAAATIFWFAPTAAVPNYRDGVYYDELQVKTYDDRSLRIASVSHPFPIGAILFLHGFGCAPRHYDRLLGRWAGMGYHVLAPVFPDSADHQDPIRPTWNDDHDELWRMRLEDAARAADELVARVPLAEGLYLAAGHSFGALQAGVLCGGGATRPAGAIVVAAP